MAGTYSQIYIQAVFAVKGRENLINASWENELFKYISGIITKKGQKSIIVNGMLDHVHVFIGLKPSMSVSDIIRDIKNNSSNFVNDNKFVNNKFSWQEGFGAFSYGQSQIKNVYDYIFNQKSHHQKRSFKQEYFALLKLFEIEFDEKYLFDWIE